MTAEDDGGGRYLVVGGRRWRATDPSIPEALRAELVHELMAARRAVRDAGGDAEAVAAARRRVHDAKVALGERGAPWWEPMPDGARDERISATTRALLRHRASTSTICPSDVARAVASPDWRAAMDAVRRVGAGMAAARELLVSRRGEPVEVPETARGPVRYGRSTGFPDPPA
jgi:hypothetical protein